MAGRGQKKDKNIERKRPGKGPGQRNGKDMYIERKKDMEMARTGKGPGQRKGKDK